MQNIFTSALELMWVGIGTVFLVLALFYGLIKLLIHLYPESLFKK
jgi:hypothetical protein